MSGLPRDFRFETERLRVEAVPDVGHPSRLSFEVAGILSPEVTAFLPPNLQVPPVGIDGAAWLATATADATVLAARDEHGALIGLVLLHPGGSEIMFGYLLAQHAWGRGYGTELVRGLATALSTASACDRLVGGVDPANAASIRVLEKAGFVRRPGQGPGGSLFYACALNDG
ncbi:MAG: GNAT family N-acetyltransferase [Rhodobacter sp.]|nr:GNAT family N-acetyltransferase [Rhodobacter sp.]